MKPAKISDNKAQPRIQMVTTNKKAYFNYQVDDSIEAGVMLTGTEAKSLRDGKVQLVDAYAKIEKGEPFLMQAHIGEYSHGSFFNHVPTRPRKLLLHKQEIKRLSQKIDQKGYTLIPLEIYFKNGKAKIKLGLCKGKAEYDKRQSIKKKDERRSSWRGDD